MEGDFIRSIRSHIRIYFFVRSQYLRARMADPYSFGMHVFSDLVIQLIGVVFFLALFGQVTSIRGWQLKDVLLIYGMAQLSYGWFGLLFWGLYDFGPILVSGAFDMYLSRPIGSLFQFHLKGLGDVGGLLLGVATIVYLSVGGSLKLPTINLLVLCICPVLGGVLYACLFSLAAAVNFWLANASSGMFSILNNLIAFGGYPVAIYPRILQLILTFPIPIAFVGFYPAAFLSGNQWGRHLALLPLIVAVIAVMTRIIWRAGAKRYESTGN
jgi:ABC-2 type transport system permease protein